jgi:alkylhydroperoxidase family enzyme
LLGDRALVEAVLEDYRTAPISDQDKALFEFIERMNRDSTRLQSDDVIIAKAAGWSDEALYDAITVCALFNFYNKWIDATGVHDLPAAAYAASGQRLASFGYIPPDSARGSSRID